MNPKEWKPRVMLLFLVLVMAFSLVNVMVGMHNIDLAYNLQKLGKEFNASLTDTTSHGNELTPDELHQLGTSQIYDFGVLAAVSLLLIGYFIRNK